MDIMRSLIVVIGVSLLMMIGLYIFPSIIFLFPLAFIVIGVKYNTMNSFISILLTSFFIGIGIDMISGLMILAIFGPLSLHIADCISKRKKPLETILTSSIIFFISIVIVFIMLRDFSGISLIEQLEENIKVYTDWQLSLIEETELTNIESFRMKEVAENLYKTFISILPAFLIILSVFISYINYYFSIIVLRRMGLGIRENPRFSRFSLPSNFIVGSMVMFLLVYLLRNFESVPYDVIYLNIIVLVICLLLIQGLSLLDSLLLRLRLSVIIRGIIIGVTLFAYPLISLFVLAGILDVVFDFRKLRRPKL